METSDDVLLEKHMDHSRAVIKTNQQIGNQIRWNTSSINLYGDQWSIIDVMISHINKMLLVHEPTEYARLSSKSTSAHSYAELL